MARLGQFYDNYVYGWNIYGSNADDTIWGYGGNDNLYGNAGSDVVYGGTGDDHIYAGTQGLLAHWGGTNGADYAYGESGSDVLDFTMTLDVNVLYGDSNTASASDGIDYVYGGGDVDFIYGGGNRDILYGRDGNDVIYGDLPSESAYDGNDVLVGGAGSDSLYGGGGDDILAGGTGGDWLTGGSGHNTFVYNAVGESGLTWSSADTITDFYAVADSIDMPTAGSYANYFEGNITDTWNTTQSSHFAYAASYASDIIGNPYTNTQYVFLTNGHDGYLFADMDGNGRIDTGIELEGVASTGNFHYWDII